MELKALLRAPLLSDVSHLLQFDHHLQERVKKKGSRPQTAPAVLLSSKTKVKLPPALVDDDQIATNVKHPTEEEPLTAPSTPSPTETY